MTAEGLGSLNYKILEANAPRILMNDRLAVQQSAETQHPESDLTDDAVTCEGFREHADNEAEHGNPSVQQLCTHHALTLDLTGGCILIPLVLGGG